MRVFLLLLLTVLPLVAATGPEDRAFTVRTAERLATPVLTALAEHRLRRDLPVIPGAEKRQQFAVLEAAGRTLAGLAPWLALGPADDEEGRLRARLADLARRGLASLVAADSPDRVDFAVKGQPLVDAAFLAEALLRARPVLWDPLEPGVKKALLEALAATRVTKPPTNNWLLFAAMVEVAQWELGGEHRLAPIEEAVRRHQEWYLGDGTYGDGPQFHWDYYNSFVIQPMLVEVLRVLAAHNHPLAVEQPVIVARACRQATLLEHLISPEGTIPIIGRSSTYRFGALRHLACTALDHRLDPSLQPGAVRAAMTAVIRRMVEAPGTFDAQGWLRPGVVGFQPSMRDSYINAGSLYLCTTGLMHLGLPATDPLWTEPASPWTQQALWSGADLPGDHALKEPAVRK